MSETYVVLFQYLPKRFMRENGVDKRRGEMILMNEKGKSWTLDLKLKKSCGTSLIRRGWRSFCSANGLRAGSIITLKLIKKRATLVLRLIPNEPEEANEVVSLSTEQESDEESIHDEKISRRKSLLSENRFVTLTLTPYTIQSSLLVRFIIPSHCLLTVYRMRIFCVNLCFSVFRFLSRG